MKRKILLTMALIAAVAVAGCGGEEAQETVAVETQAPVIETQAPAPTEEPLDPSLPVIHRHRLLQANPARTQALSPQVYLLTRLHIRSSQSPLCMR